MANPINPPPHALESDDATATRPGSPMVVAITGSRGILGARVVEALSEDPRILRLVAVDDGTGPTCSEKVTRVGVDLTAHDAVQRLGRVLTEQRVETVIHLSFHDGPSPHPGKIHELESIGTLHLVLGSMQAKVKKIISSSRSWLYGASPYAPALLDESQPLRARRTERFFADKIDAERDILAFRVPGRARFSTILRMAPVVDPAVQNHVLCLLSAKRVPSILGYDPMWQLLHVEDACQAISAALFRETPAIVNVAATGAVPLSVARRLLGARPVSLPRSMAGVLTSTSWLAGMGPIPPSYLDYLQYPCVLDWSLAKSALGFAPKHTTLSTLQQAAASLGINARSAAA